MEAKSSSSPTPAARAKQQLPPPKSPAVARPSPTGFFARYGNTILTVVLLILAGLLAYRWWSRSANDARLVVLNQLTTARQEVDQLRSPQLAQLPAAQVVGQAKLVEAEVKGAVTDVINRADDPVTKGRALLVRADLNWYLANLPVVPGAATQPALRPDLPPDQYLAQAADGYTAVTDLAGADAQTVAAAKLGLAAVAENRRDWPTARTQLEAVAGETGADVAVMASAARAALADLHTLEEPVYLSPGSQVPPEGPPQPTTLPTTGPTTAPAITAPVTTAPITTRSAK